MKVDTPIYVTFMSILVLLVTSVERDHGLASYYPGLGTRLGHGCAIFPGSMSCFFQQIEQQDYKTTDIVHKNILKKWREI